MHMDRELRVAFVSAPYRIFDTYRKVGKHPTNGIVTLAGELLDHGITDDVRIFDGAFYGSMEELVSDVKSFEPSMLGIPGYTGSMPEAERIFKSMPDVPIKITGGPYSSARPEELLEYCDVVFVGEAEESIKEFAAAAKENGKFSPDYASEIKGLVFKDKDGSVVRTGKPRIVSDLDSISFRGRELTADHMPHYRVGNYRHLGDNFITLMSSRGCASKCIYCCSNMMHGSGYRLRSPESLEAEIDFVEDLRKKRGLPPLDSVKFDDDEFFSRNENDLANLLHVLNKRDLRFTAFVTMGATTPEKVRIAAENGMKSAFTGIETHEGRRKKVCPGKRSRFTDEEIKETLEWFRKHDVRSCCGYIVGFPDETLDDMRMTSDCMTKLPVDYPSMSVLAIHPGTPLWRWQQKNVHLYKDLVKKPFSRVDVERWPGDPDGLPSPHPEMAKGQLLAIKKEAYRAAYNDPDRIFRLMKAAKDPSEALKTMVAFNEFYFDANRD